MIPLSGADLGLHRLETDGAAAAALRDGSPRVEEVDGERVYYEPLVPPLRLLVCGAGHDAIPLVRHAAELGWTVVVVDVRRALLTSSVFPARASSQARIPSPSARRSNRMPEPRWLMNHNYLRTSPTCARSWTGRSPTSACSGRGAAQSRCSARSTGQRRSSRSMRRPVWTSGGRAGKVAPRHRRRILAVVAARTAV